jgi:sn-glycerol 3-phosphate transport system substrate-binding protein
LYAIPYNRSTQGFYVNNDLIRKAGLPGPAKTWRQFEADARTLKQKLGAEYYYGYAFFHQFLFDAISYTWNAAISSPEGKILLNSPEQIAMMEYFQKLYRENLLLMQPVLVGGFQEQHGAFLDGKVVSVFQTTSFLPTAVEMLDSDWSFEYIPAGPGGHAITVGGGNITVSSTVTEVEKAAVKKFLEYISSLDVVAQFFIETGNMPVRRSSLGRGDIKEYIAKNPSAQTMLDQLEFGRPAPSLTKNIGDVFSRVNDIVTRIVYEGHNAKTVLDEYTKQFQADFDELIANGEFIY